MSLYFILSLILFCLILYRGWLYHSLFREKITPKIFLKRYFAFDLDIIISILMLVLKKDNIKLNALTIIVWVLITILFVLPLYLTYL